MVGVSLNLKELTMPGTDPAQLGIDNLSLQMLAAILLRVPNSGNQFIDRMITTANERDAHLATANGVLSNSANPPQDPVGTVPIINQYKGRI